MFDIDTTVRLSKTAGLVSCASILPMNRDMADQLQTSWWNWDGVDSKILQSQPDRQWNWAQLAKTHRDDPCFNLVALVTQDREIQGAMLVGLDNHADYKDCDSILSPGRKGVYIEYVATAPWNRKALCNPRRYKGVGAALLEHARTLSRAKGYRGRLILDSKFESLAFYQNKGFRILTRTPHGTVFCELPEESAVSMAS